MDDWEYAELSEAVNRTYIRYLERKLSVKHALARTSYDFETVRNEGIIENIIVSTAIGELILTHQVVFIGNLNAIEKVLNECNSDVIAGQLSEEEFKDLTNRIKNVLSSIKEMPIDYNPSV